MYRLQSGGSLRIPWDIRDLPRRTFPRLSLSRNSCGFGAASARSRLGRASAQYAFLDVLARCKHALVAVCCPLDRHVIPISVPKYHGTSASLAIVARKNVALLNAGSYQKVCRKTNKSREKKARGESSHTQVIRGGASCADAEESDVSVPQMEQRKNGPSWNR